VERLPLIKHDHAPPAVRDVYDRLDGAGLAKFMHQAEALAHHPPLLEAVAQLLLAYYHHSTVERRYLELAILATSARNSCEYCVIHHTPQGVDTGLTLAQVDAIIDGTWRQTDLFDETDVLVLAYAEQVTDDANRVSDELFYSLRQQFDDQQLLELTMRIATCGFFNRFNDALRLPVEPIASELFETARANGAHTSP
jgi:AhpD family alkylhydroperoxidase